MKTAVTGAAGFIGTNLVNLLVENGHEVIAIDRVVPASPETREAVTWVSGDVLDLDSMTKALEGVEVVYHLVAVITLKHEDELCWRINTEGARTVAQAALTVGPAAWCTAARLTPTPTAWPPSTRSRHAPRVPTCLSISAPSGVARWRYARPSSPGWMP
ncbi:polysaccharide biosynthesis family protein [Mycobacteroides abscessus subsp. bolletii 1513]|uniref:Polysaccharide biosynthesis family protein n=1 Tax=Mycobacteroides abscessus subsp. bolletii 1513 TaxID=1299321 RepID=X8DYX6_9MYCO|nr:polysaccharide biosynthesis family protein [Mycobacteroides abscessus subsp. bolletii 1513]